MSKCVNMCDDSAEMNFAWPTSRGHMCANFCGSCASVWWSKYKNTPAGQGVCLSPPKSAREMAEICKEYEDE